MSWHHHQLMCGGHETLPANNIGDRCATVGKVLRSLAMLTSVHDDTIMMTYMLLDLPHRASVSHHARFESGRGRTFLWVKSAKFGLDFRPQSPLMHHFCDIRNLIHAPGVLTIDCPVFPLRQFAHPLTFTES